ncbi:PspC domain-containing protein [Raineyella sp. W15-4]|uniref:PspC domain-containing protein n=1 Tax=Raineyella sp. W15-4 TaxID=3081651 RepID=UPI002954E57D|nr:PspC domain-containing protein [Raineyella sp. W15-4]WOQ16406.1 PspC domain-containing protein [Raineyella sp. W15-4]
MNDWYRPRNNRVIAGVCAGIARKLGIGANWVRLAFILLIWFAGVPLWIYLIGWILMPNEP